MPRNPGAKKNQHNHRHENGLVGPGKRVAKQKSNGHINSSAKGAVPDTPPLTPTGPSASANPSAGAALTTHSKPPSNSLTPQTNSDNAESSRLVGLAKRHSESSADGHESNVNTNGDVREKRSDERLRPFASPSTKSRQSSELNSFQMASSILKSCPAYDTVALLILLLQLPPVILIVVQALFASLTFMPPNGFSLGSTLSFVDVFQGSAGAPSLGTMLFVDGICFALWFCLWSWLRNFALDLAQIQIALTLGGGTSGKFGRVTTLCVALTFMLHLVRSRGVRRFLYSSVYSFRVMENQHVARLARLTRLLPQESGFGQTPASPSWLHSLFALHIVAQACMAFIRRRVATSQAGAVTKAKKRTDTEASAGSQLQEAAVMDSSTSTASVTVSDVLPSPISISKEGKEKGISAKKRRRQANQVRSRQPFWAALASTKVTVLREYEHSRGSSNFGGRNLDEKLTSSIGEEQITITHIDPSSIGFEATNIEYTKEEREVDLESSCRPFYVRINGAKWHSVFLESAEHRNLVTKTWSQWTGQISGLAPNCTYTCSFVRYDDDQEFDAVMVKTPSLLEGEQPSLFAPRSPRHSLRPSSPTTTIRNSIQSAEAKLNEARTRLSKTRRSHKAVLAKIDKEVDGLEGRLQSSSDDNKLKQKLLQAERNIRQTEDAALIISTALEDLANIPEGESEEYRARRAAFQERSELLSTANETLVSARSAAKQELTAVNNELSQISARRERIVARQTRLQESHDRITQANAQGMNERDRKAADSFAKASEQARIEIEFHNQFIAYNQELYRLQTRTNQSWQEVQAFEKQRDAIFNSAGPMSPEGPPLSSTNSHQATTRPLGFGAMLSSVSEPQVPPFCAFAKTAPYERSGRPRSTSNRSAGAVSNLIRFHLCLRPPPVSWRSMSSRAGRTAAAVEDSKIQARSRSGWVVSKAQ